MDKINFCGMFALMPISSQNAFSPSNALILR